MARFETLEPDWLSFRESLERVMRRAAPLPVEEVPLERATRRVLARDLTARATLPPWDNSAMDGYAVRGADLAGASDEAPVTLEVSGVVRAGEEPVPDVEPGRAVRIMTGAPVPDGADSVVRVEHTDAEEERAGRVRIFSEADRERNIRPAGEDFRAGETAIAAGTPIGSGQVAVLAAQGYGEVPVHGRPVVALLPNGDELAPLAEFEAVREGRAIPESNGPALAAAVRDAGGRPLLLEIARDTRESILERLDEAREADALVTLGGASMGEADLLKRVLAERGLEIDFWRQRVRPGTPFSLGFLSREEDERPPQPVFGLPGNPASAFVTFQMLVRPYLLALAGHPRPHRPRVRARAADDLRSSERHTHFLRVKLEEDGESEPEAHLTGPQRSGLVQSLGRADGLAVVPEGVEAIPAGDPVTVVLLGEGPGWRASPEF